MHGHTWDDGKKLTAENTESTENKRMCKRIRSRDVPATSVRLPVVAYSNRHAGGAVPGKCI